MKKIFLLLCLLSIAGLSSGQVRVKLNNALAVTFPSQPAKTKTDSNTTFYSANLNSAFYLVTVKDMSEGSNLALYNDSLVNLYTELVNTTIKRSRAKLNNKKYITINDNKAIAFDYQMTDDASIMPDSRFQQSVYVDKMLISFSFWTFKDKLNSNATNKDVFFGSISKPEDESQNATYNTSVKPDAIAGSIATVKQDNVGITVSATNFKPWYIGALVFLVVVIGGIILYVSTKKKDNEQ